MSLAEMMMKGQLQIVLQMLHSPLFLEPRTVGIDENQGRVEGNLILRKTQGAEEVGKVEYGADELAAAQGSEQLHTTVFAFKKDCVVVGIVGPAHSDEDDFHCSWVKGIKMGGQS